MNGNKTLKIGRYGELIASFYLKNKGYSILARNLRLNNEEVRGEIDILALKDKILHVVEVKTACVIGLQVVIFAPESNLSQMKIRKLRKLRRVLIMRMSEGDSLLGDKMIAESSVPYISKVVITGVAVYLFMKANSSDSVTNKIRDQIRCIKVRVFNNL